MTAMWAILAFRFTVLINLALTLGLIPFLSYDYGFRLWDFLRNHGLAYMLRNPWRTVLLGVPLHHVLTVMAEIPSFVLCVALLGLLLFRPWARALTIVFLPLASISSYLLLVKKTEFSLVAVAPVPMVAAAILALLMCRPSIKARFACDGKRSPV
jgi:hypothetical protein